MRKLPVLFLLVACTKTTAPTATPAAQPQSQPTPIVQSQSQPEAIPAFSLKTVDGNTITEKDLAGKVVLLNFWESSCGPCKAEFPAIELLHQTYQAEGLMVLGVSVDEELPVAERIANEYKLSFPNAYDGSALYRSLGGNGTPFTVLFEKDHIAAKVIGRRTEEFFEGLVWASLSLSPRSRIGSPQVAAKAPNAAKAMKPAPTPPPPPKPLASEANGWKLERIEKYGGNFGALSGVKRGKGFRVFAGGFGAIFASDGDGTWKVVSDDPQIFRVKDFWAASEKEIYAVGEDSPIMYSADGGDTWKALGERQDLSAIWGSSPKDIYAVGAKGLIIHSSDGGKSWQEQQSNVTLLLSSVWGSGPSDIYIGATFGIILHSTDQGKSWQKLDTKTDATFLSIWGSSPDNIYAVGGVYSGVLARSTDRGKTWTTQILDKEEYLGNILGFSANDLWVAGKEIYRSTDDGKTWTAVSSIPDAPILYIWGPSPNELYTAGPNNTIQHFKK